ncbi:hypothetical protein KTH46_16775 [Acinetobacter bereziniae]|uniref:hypothetical protein n=1 Tax=Acinetobacter bereziniae TaxID=106648 RepID=UPI0021CFAD3D|nr:hypothetical protein [Acinetobacter bereziniae]MCU4316666.1 hypothetical protein [Acinetobacter bereziniae]
MEKAIIELRNAFKIVLAICLFFLLFMIIYFQLTNTPLAFKEAISLTFSLASILSTLVAAYIALIIYDGWRLTHNKTVDKEIVFGVISNLNNFLLDSQHFHNSISQVVSSAALNEFILNKEEYFQTINYLRKIIRDHEDSVCIVANNYSDLESVMSEEEYTTFLTYLNVVTDSVILVHKGIIKDLIIMNKLPEPNQQLVNFYFVKFQNILDQLSLTDDGIIVRLKMIKKELANFYRA